MTLLEIHQRHKEELQQELVDLYKGKINAGIGTVGDFKNRISELEKQFKEIDEKIDNEAWSTYPKSNSLPMISRSLKSFLHPLPSCEVKGISLRFSLTGKIITSLIKKYSFG